MSEGAERVRAIGGWRSLCMSTNDVADRARFIEAFGVTVGRERAEMRMLPEVRAAAARLMAPRQQALSGGRDDGRDNDCSNGSDRQPPASQERGELVAAPDQEGPGEGGGDDHQARPGSHERGGGERT